MNISAFIETTINTLKYDSNYKEKKDKLLPILRRATINSIPQYAFAVRSGQHYENIEVRVPVPLIDEANALKDDIKNLVEYVYEETDEYALGKVLIKPKIMNAPVDENIEHDVIFSEIQDTLVQGIRDAKFLIWAAVAWFSKRRYIKNYWQKKSKD